MNLALIIAILSPFIFGFMNTFDKYVISHRVKFSLGYAVVSGLVNIFFGLSMVLFLSWDFNTASYLFPVLAGILSGFAYYFYYFLMKDSDVSYLVGFIYLYPVVVAFLSFIFLSERLPVIAYFAIALILVGVILLSLRAKKIKASLLILPLAFYITILGCYEFFIKVSTNNMPFMQGLAITIFISGLTIMLGLFSRHIRHEFIIEVRNIKWAFIGEFITLVATLTLYFAMSRLTATLVASLASLQPLAVIIFERAAHKYYGKMTKDNTLLPKLGAILLIVLGVIILSIFGT